MDRMLNEIWTADIHWSLQKDIKRGVYMHNTNTGVDIYGETADEVVRKVWLYIYA